MKKIQNEKIMRIIVSVLILVLLLLFVFYIGQRDKLENKEKNDTSGNEVIIEHEKEFEGGLSVEEPGKEEKTENEKTTPFIDSNNATKNDSTTGNAENSSSDSTTDSNANMNSGESTDSKDDIEQDDSDSDVETGLDQNKTESTGGKYGDFF